MPARIDLNHKVHVLTRREELDHVRVPGKVIVVLDILFATTTMVAALAHGAREVVPVLDEAGARAQAKAFPAGAFVLAGELNAEVLPGFAHPAPLSLIEHGVAGKTLVYSTTNGTVAMTQAAGAARKPSEPRTSAPAPEGRAVVARDPSGTPDYDTRISPDRAPREIYEEDPY